jgi:acyl-coenzyme A synthetase/AMP-(fatty) acid ligase
VQARIKKLGLRGLVSDHAAFDEFQLSTVRMDESCLADSAVVAADIPAPGGDAIWIISETSGTTAEPKLIGVSHRVEEAQGERVAPIFGHLPRERFLTLTNMRFLTGIRRSIRCLGDGGTLALPPSGLSAGQLLHWIDVHHVTYINCVPSHLFRLLRDVPSDFPRLKSVRILRCGTAALPVTTLDEVRRRISPNVFVSYGANEVGGMAGATPEMLAAHPKTVGKAYQGVELEIVDDARQPLPPGASGLIRVRTPGVPFSYLYSNGPGEAGLVCDDWFYPGDIGTKNEDGLVFLEGRADDVMNFDGILVGPAEIESVLLQHPSVTDAAAFPLSSLEHQDVPAAAVVSRVPLQLNQLARFCAERLGVRTPQVFVQLEEIPKNPMGKILRRRLSELALANLHKASNEPS